MTRWFFVAVAGLWLASITHAADKDAGVRLEEAIYLEETVGDLDRAIEQYRRLSSDENAAETVRSQARQRLANCLQKKGQAVDVAEQAAQKEDLPANRLEEPLASAIQEALEAIEANYAFPLERRRLVTQALQSLAASLEGESDYLTREQFEELSKNFDQQLVGIGVQLKNDDGELVVVAPLPGSPSEKAGVLPGDRLLAAGDTKFDDLPQEKRLTMAVNAIRGRAGDEVTLEIQRPGVEGVRKLTVRRAPIQIENVRGDRRAENGDWKLMLDEEHKIGYLRVLQFGARTADELGAAVTKLQEQGAKGLVLDLRYNPGGLLQEATEVCDLFLKEGTIVSVRSQGDKQQAIEAKAEGTLEDLPLALLINRHTGSAAEIVAASLQDHARATLVGERTFGQGVVRSLLPIKSTGGALRLATGIWVRPNGGAIYRPKGANAPKDQEAQAGGVVPNAGFEVPLSEEELQQYLKYRHDRDVLPAQGEDQPKLEDRQLAKALAHLREKIAQ